jgi:hypothetical protein
MSSERPHLRGERNSSITRVRPVFEQLIRRDTHTWLPALLRLSRAPLASVLASDPGVLDPACQETRPYPDRVLKRHGIAEVQLARCFEHRLPPPKAFLNWLIEHPERMRWPTGKHYAAEKERLRRCLMGDSSPEAAASAQCQAREELNKAGAAGSKRKWWAFEGFSEVDCFLETERLILLIEGKRTEALSAATNWFPQRNQLVRLLEVGACVCGTKQFGVMLLTETPLGPLSPKEVADSLPHLELAQQTSLLDHYLGEVSWQTLCAATGVDYSALPDTILDVIARLAPSKDGAVHPRGGDQVH